MIMWKGTCSVTRGSMLSAGNNFSSLAGHVSFQIFISVGHLINLTGHQLHKEKKLSR